MGGEGDRGGPAVYKRIANFSRELCAGRTNGRGKRRHTEGTRGRFRFCVSQTCVTQSARTDRKVSPGTKRVFASQASPSDHASPGRGMSGAAWVGPYSFVARATS